MIEENYLPDIWISQMSKIPPKLQGASLGLSIVVFLRICQERTLIFFLNETAINYFQCFIFKEYILTFSEQKRRDVS